MPLLEPNDNLSLSEVADQVTTLNSDNADISKAKRVFSSNQVYKNLLISEDLKTTAIQLTLKRNLNYENLVNERYQLYDDESSNFDSKLELINEKINKERQEISKKERELVEEIRSILKNYDYFGELFRWRLNDYSRYDRLYFSRLDYFWNSCFFNFFNCFKFNI